MKDSKIHNEYCPICEYAIQHCQCIFCGSAHPDRDRRKKIVKDHLELLSMKQISHLVALEEFWQRSYINPEDAAEFERLKNFLNETKPTKGEEE
ncbi:MAG: hypothetical protein IKG59_01855 [Firmicutes bacterium]|nr:hypothetical protein [Bacillota bacterium]